MEINTTLYYAHVYQKLIGLYKTCISVRQPIIDLFQRSPHCKYWFNVNWMREPQLVAMIIFEVQHCTLYVVEAKVLIHMTSKHLNKAVYKIQTHLLTDITLYIHYAAKFLTAQIDATSQDSGQNDV